MKTNEILEQAGFYQRKKPFASHLLLTLWVKDKILRAGEFPIKAAYTQGGNCIICGEVGRCPGWHTEDDLRRDESQLVVVLQHIATWLVAPDFSEETVRYCRIKVLAAIAEATGERP